MKVEKKLDRTKVIELAGKIRKEYAELKRAGVRYPNFSQLLREIITPEIPSDELQFYCSAVAQEIQRRINAKKHTSPGINRNFVNQSFAGLPRGDRD